MHKRWQDLLPFYVAGTLSASEEIRLEEHLSHCTECRAALADWQAVCSAVRSEMAARWVRTCPPRSTLPALPTFANRPGPCGRAAHMPQAKRLISLVVTVFLLAVFTWPGPVRTLTLGVGELVQTLAFRPDVSTMQFSPHPSDSFTIYTLTPAPKAQPLPTAVGAPTPTGTRNGCRT